MSFWTLLRLLKNAPLAVKAAMDLYAGIKGGPDKTADLLSELENLKNDAARQSDIISDLGGRIRALSDRLERVSLRLRIFIWISSVALLLSLTLLAIVIFR